MNTHKMEQEYYRFAESVRDVEVYDKCKKISVEPILKKHKKRLEQKREKLQKEAIAKFNADKTLKNFTKTIDKEHIR